MKVSIEGLDKAEVLLNLYNNAHMQGKAWENHPIERRLGIMSRTYNGKIELARELINAGQNSFGSIFLGASPRTLNITFDGNEIDTAAYDDYHGEGLGERIISNMRKNLAEGHETIPVTLDANANTQTSNNPEFKPRVYCGIWF